MSIYAFVRVNYATRADEPENGIIYTQKRERLVLLDSP